MHKISPSQFPVLRPHFLPERPGPLVGTHVINTGCGEIQVDRWPNPRVLLANTGLNCVLAGNPEAISPAQLRAALTVGLVDAPTQFIPVIREAFPDYQVWDRVIYALEGELQVPAPPKIDGAEARMLGPGDEPHLRSLDPEFAWIWVTWNNAENFAARGNAWGAFADGQLVSVACTFFKGDQYEDIGVITDTDYRRKGLSAVCTYSLCQDIRKRGNIPSWSTTPDNIGSQRVAEKIGFKPVRKDVLYVIGSEIPE